MLDRFGISVSQVAGVHSRHRETRERLREFALIFAGDSKVIEMRYASGKLRRKDSVRKQE